MSTDAERRLERVEEAVDRLADRYLVVRAALEGTELDGAALVLGDGLKDVRQALEAQS